MTSDDELDVAALRERLQQCESRLHAMQQVSEIGQFMAAEPELDRVLDELGRRTSQLMECERATLYALSDDGRAIAGRVVGTVAPSAGVAVEDAVHVVELKLGQGIAGWVAEHGRAVNVKDAYRDPRFVPRIDQITGFRTSSILCQPMRDRHGRTIGVLQALNKKEGYFSTADEALLETIAGQAAVVLRNARLLADLAKKQHALLDTQVRLQERNSEMDLMFAIERAAAVAKDLGDALDGALLATLSEYPCDAAAVMLLDEGDGAIEQRCWRVRRAAGIEAARIEHASGAASEPLLREALVEGRELLLFDDPVLSAVPSVLKGFERLETIAVIPLKWRERDVNEGEEHVLGALLLVNSRRFPKGFDDLDVHKLGVIASRMALSVTLAGALEEERKAERLAAVGGALSGIVHDLRTPLTLLDGYARLMQREESAGERQSLRDRHKRQIELLNGMIQDVLAFARGQSQVLPRKVWMREFLGEVEEALRIELHGTNVALTVDSDYRGAVRMDDVKMKRVIANLAKNSREAMGERGGELRIGAAADPADARRVIMRVSDTGPGIPAEMEGRLFQSFATHGKAHGTGLGLAIVKTIVDQHEGTLAVESAPGRGTTFVIGLPVA